MQARMAEPPVAPETAAPPMAFTPAQPTLPGKVAVEYAIIAGGAPWVLDSLWTSAAMFLGEL